MHDLQFEATVAEIRGFDLGDDEQLLAHLDSRVADGLSGDEWLLRGVLLVRAGQPDEALDCFEHAVEQHGNVRAHHRRQIHARFDAAIKKAKAELVALNTNLEGIVAARTQALSEALQHQRFLTAELSHRVKNTIAGIQSIVDQTLRRASVARDVRSVLRGRLSAMARVHEKLAVVEWAGVSLRDVLSGISAPYGVRIRIDCNGEVLTPRATLDLGLVFHELATNAAKHGALSTAAGRVTVSVARRTAADSPVEIVWREEGGGSAAKPAQEGFGLNLVRQLTRHNLKGECELRFGASGFACTIRVPAAEALDVRAGCGHVH